jgi:Raf kinase inhibitor-like YbhB/YbcL family protein
MQLTTPAFNEGDTIPIVHTGDGKDTSPPLSWSGVPENTKSFALICDDPDAPIGTWVHWVLFNIPPDQTSLAEGISTKGVLPDGSRQGKNGWGNLGYRGPAPPKGKPHRYYFKLYALDATLSLDSGATKDQVVAAMKGHIMAEAQLMGHYGRK